MVYRPETVWELGITPSITFGRGAVEEVGAIADSHDATTVLVITDEGVAGAGILDDVTASLDDIDHHVYADVEPDPSVDVFEDAVETAATVDPDFIVGVGGGSSMDVAKTTSVVHEHGGSILDYVSQPTGSGKSVPGPGVPTACVPTTAGTGSETSPVTVISLPDEDLKVGISSQHQRPDAAVVDPGLTITLPPGPTASAGMDALSHAIEAYVTRRYDAKPAPASRDGRPDYNGRSEMTDLFARAAIDNVGGNLRDAVNNGEDVTARRQMALASLQAGIAFTNAGLGATHALAMAIGAVHHTPHGVTIAMVLPAVMRYNATSAFDRYADIARLLGEDLTATSQDEAAEAAARAVEKLATDIGIDGGLSSLGVGEDDLPHLADRAHQLQRLLDGNPRRVTESDLQAIMEQSL